jgi:uncharacterized protein with GYD domain
MAGECILTSGQREKWKSRLNWVKNKNQFRRRVMPKYLLEVSYSPEGAKGLLKDGGTKRRQVVEAAIKANGGKLEAFYFAFGENDAYLIADGADHVSVAAMNLAVNASGAARIKTTILLTPEEIDQASKKSIAYNPPGR